MSGGAVAESGFSVTFKEPCIRQNEFIGVLSVPYGGYGYYFHASSTILVRDKSPGVVRVDGRPALAVIK